MALATLFFVLSNTPGGDRVEAGSLSELSGVLTEATMRPMAQVDVRLDELPDETTRAWLSALRGAGTDVRWREIGTLPATTLSVEPIASPDRPRRVSLAGAPAGPVIIRDALGVIDSATVTSDAAREADARVSGPVEARVRGATLRVSDTDSVNLRAVLVIGRAGWEARFTAAALEEAGWQVETEFLVTPRGASGPAPDAGRGSAVRTRGASAAIDTARYAAVVALDASASARASAISGFVREGGGLILGHDAAAGSLRELAPARSGAAFREALGGLLSSLPRRGLAGHALVNLVPDALILERRGPAITMAAQRQELGRVVLIAYDDLWRWRMEGGEMAPEDHRAWWSHLVASVAFSPTMPAGHDGGDPAPLAALHAALGVPKSAVPGAPAQSIPWALVLGSACILLLMIEWTSRRLRGAP